MAIVVLGLAAPASGQEIPALTALTATVASSNPELVGRRAALVQERATLHGEIDSLNAGCAAVEKGSAAEGSCNKDRAAMLSALNSHIQRSKDFNSAAQAAAGKGGNTGGVDSIQAPPPSQASPPNYVPSGNALIGGTGWEFGYNVPPGSKPELLAKSQEIAKRLAEAEGVPYNKEIDFKKYNFVLGIASSTDIFNDLKSRVVFDEFSNGQFSAVQQQTYNSLKGRQFDELACHSNGAMICLAALENHDTLAKHIVLYGPQITPESLHMWDGLVRSGRISTIQIYINQGDPVPAISMLASQPTAALTAIAAPVLAAPLFDAEALSRAVSIFAPSANVKTFACSNVITTDCHDMTVYKKNSGPCPASPGKIVPGTSIPDRGGAIEPPPPC